VTNMSDNNGNQAAIPQDGHNTERFLSLLMTNQKRIYAFVLAMVPNQINAEDILQETVTEMWKKFGDYEVGTNFVAWACTIAKYKILQFRRKQGTSKLKFSDELIDLLQPQSEEVMHSMEDRIDSIKRCIKKLSKKDILLIRMRYEQDCAVKTIALRAGKSLQSVYQNLNRIHKMLLRCVERLMASENI
jgi:RNA polymerase sigma-70 factor (ECF subfamily)